MPLCCATLILTGAIPARSDSGGPSGAAVSPAPAPFTLERVARFPPPGLRVAKDFRFTHDGRFLYYLALEGDTPARVLVREEVSSGRHEVVGRAPGAAGDAGLSREEALRRERQRIQDQGITQYVLAEEADRAVYALGGDLYLVRPGSSPSRLTSTEAAELDPQLSPDGRRLAFVRDGDLHVLDLESGAATRLTTGATDLVRHGVAEFIAQEEMARPSGYWWSPDGSRIAFTETDESAIPAYPIVHQGQPEWDVEEHRYPFSGGRNARVRLGVVPAAGGPVAWLALDDRSPDDLYLARARFGPDGSLYAQVESRDQTRLRLLRFAPPEFGSKVLLEETATTWIDLHDDFRPLRDGRFLWSSERSGWRHLELRAADGSLVTALTAGPWEVDRLEGIDERGGLVYFTAAKDGPLDRPVYRVPLDGGEVTRLTPEDGQHAVTFAPDGRAFVDVHDSATEPPRALLRAADGRVRRVLDANDDPEVAALGLRPPRFVTLGAEDGTTLHGALYAPDGIDAAASGPVADAPRHPAIVRVYGGPTVNSVKNAWELTADLRAQFLVRQGYVVFRLDNRGTPRRGRAFEDAIFHRLGQVEVRDQVAGARWLAARPFVDPDRIGVYGWSYGGYMSALLILEAPEIFKAAVVGAPVTDWDGYDTHYTERYMGTPQGNPEGYREASVLPKAARLTRPLLLIHGMSDENVHFRHTARLLNALNAAGKTYDLLVFPDERHLPRRIEDRVFMERRLVEHFDRALKTR